MKNFKEDKRPQKGEWAPGEYINTCFKCGEGFIGDKRALICADCAYGEQAYKVEHVSQEAIQESVFSAMKEGRVAILATKDDLETIIAALLLSENNRMAMKSKWKEIRSGLEQLKAGAFPEK